MPVSSPSYFPPSRNSDRIVGITAGNNQTGNNVFLAGYQTGLGSTSDGIISIGHEACGAITGQANPVIIGVTAATALYGNSGRAPNDAPVIIGYNALQNTASADGSVVIGGNNFKQNIANSGANPLGINKSIILGFEIANGASAWGSALNMQYMVMIGNNIMPSTSTPLNPSGCVIIGHNIGFFATDFSAGDTVVIGYQACYSASQLPPNSVVIGTSAATNIRASAQYVCAIGNTCAPNLQNGQNVLYLGSNAGSGYSDLDYLMVITPNQISGTIYNLDSVLASLMNPQTDGAANVELCGLASNNNLKITGLRNGLILNNGTVGTANPKAGGYFYVNAGALHWVGSNGTDTLIAPA